MNRPIYSSVIDKLIQNIKISPSILLTIYLLAWDFFNGHYCTLRNMKAASPVDLLLRYQLETIDAPYLALAHNSW